MSLPVYTHKGFEKSKETEENNRVRKSRDLFKKMRNARGTFHAKTGTIKDRNGMDLTKAKDFKESWKEHTEELLKKILITWITMMM